MHTSLCHHHPSFLQSPETLSKSSAMTASFPGPKALYPSPLPKSKKSKLLTGVSGVLYIEALINLNFYLMSTGLFQDFFLLLPKHNWPFADSTPFLLLTPASPAWAALPSFSAHSAGAKAASPTKCHSTSTSSSCLHVSCPANLSSQLCGFLCVSLTRSSQGPGLWGICVSSIS